MENETQIIDYCDAFNQKAKQYQDSVQEVIFGAEKESEQICNDLGIVFLSGSN